MGHEMRRLMQQFEVLSKPQHASAVGNAECPSKTSAICLIFVAGLSAEVMDLGCGAGLLSLLALRGGYTVLIQL